MSADEEKRERLERTARLLAHGADVTGASTGAAIGLLGGPAGALGGAVIGTLVQKVLLRLGSEFEQRHLGPREKARVAGALYYALDDIEERLRESSALRDDEFFDEEPPKPREDDFFEDDTSTGRARADELLEAVLVRAQRDHEERKVKHLGWLYSSFVFNEDITPGDANYLLDLAAGCTYHQLQLLSLFHSGRGYRGLPGWERLHPYEWRAHALAGELFQLTQAGLLMRTDHKPILTLEDANPSYLWVAPTGCKLYHWMRLDRMDEEELADVYDELSAAVELPPPHELLEQLESAVDSEPLTWDDIGECRVRVRADERARALLPAPGAEVHARLVDTSVGFRVQLAPDEPEVIELVCFDEKREAFLAVLDIEEGRILRVAPAPEGALMLD
jgi:hypothetical protein